MTMPSTVEIEPVGDAVGAEVVGATVDDLLDPAVAHRLLDALERFGVLSFRGVDLDDATQVAFTRLLGEPVVLPGAAGEHPEIFKVTLDPQKNRAAEYLKSTFFWHIDGATDDVPTRGTLLTARDVADEGGDTEFAGTYAAYDAMPDDERAVADGLRVRHTFEAAQRLMYPEPSEEELAHWRMRPGKEHPLVWRHADGRRSLVLGATAECVVGMDRDESDAYLARVLDWATQPQFVYRHHWEVGDLVIWDNRGTMHRALPYSPTSDRIMHRTTLVGDEAIS
jgi:alpha-ketoglutarate-dependent taurine dioxygenase